LLSVFHPQLKEAIGTASTTLPLPFDPVVEEVQWNRACSLPSRESAPAVATPQSGEEEEEMERVLKESSGRRRGLNLMSAKRAAAGVRLETRARNTVA
jgi:hypothetical protein